MVRGSFSYRFGAFSQLFNALIGKGNRDQTFSARAYEGRIKGVFWCKGASRVIDWLWFWEPDHTRRSFYSDNEITYTRLMIIKKDK